MSFRLNVFTGTLDLVNPAITVPLPVTQGGTGTTTQFTQGSVVFAGASGVYSQDNSNFFWDDTNNRLGIGTTTPASLLTLNRASATANQLLLTNNTDATGSYSSLAFQFSDSNSSIYSAIRSIQRAVGANGSSLAFITEPAAGGTAEVMRLQHDGTVGIGTTAPQGKFQVLTSGSLTTDTDSNTEVIITGADHSASTNLGNVAIISNSTATNGFGGSLVFGGKYTGGNVATFGKIAGLMTGSSYTGVLAFYTRKSDASLPERMRIDESGNVGIGTTSPSQLLQVSKNQNAETQVLISNTTAGTGSSVNALFTSDSGSEGIGKFSSTTTAYKNIHSSDGFLYNNSVGGNLSFLNDNTTGNINFAAGASSTAQILVSPGGQLTFATAASTFDPYSIGKYGSLLQFNGGSTGYLFNNDANNANLVYIDNTGNTGIKTTILTDNISGTAQLSIAIGSGRFTVGGNAKTVSISDGGVIPFWLASTSGDGSAFGTFSSDPISFKPNNTTAMTILPGGNVGIGTVSPDVRLGQSLDVSTSAADGGMSLSNYKAASAGPILDFKYSRNNTIGSHTIVQSGDLLGDIEFRGSDGTVFRTAAAIASYVDGTPGSADMPGSLYFYTVPDGSTTITERMHIDNAGLVNVAGLTASKGVATDASKNLVSVTNATVVGSVRSAGEVAAKTLTAYTVGAADTSFIISANVLVTTATLHNFTVVVDYTDEGNTARTETLPFSVLAGTFITAITNAGGAVPYTGIPVHIRAKASTTITISTTGTFTNVAYNLEERIVQE